MVQEERERERERTCNRWVNEAVDWFSSGQVSLLGPLSVSRDDHTYVEEGRGYEGAGEQAGTGVTHPFFS